MKLIKRYKDNSCFIFNYDLYNQVKDTIKTEYSVDDLSHKIYDKIRQAYYRSPWHKVQKFKYEDHICIVDKIVFVFDSGYVLKLKYHYYDDNDNKICRYRYIENINSVKYLRLLRFKDITIL